MCSLWPAGLNVALKRKRCPFPCPFPHVSLSSLNLKIKVQFRKIVLKYDRSKVTPIIHTGSAHYVVSSQYDDFKRQGLIETPDSSKTVLR